MQPTTRSPFAATMLLGLVMALAIALVTGTGDTAWLGFALAAVYADRRPGS